MAMTVLDPVSNGAEETLLAEQPYSVSVIVEGVAPFLFHRWNNEAVEAKSRAAKGSKAKREDDLESYVYRTTDGDLAIPGEYFRMAIVQAARYSQDPRSPRKSAMDLFRAGVVALDDLCSLGVREWSYLDRRRVQVQRNGVTRVRPAMERGWRVSVGFQVLTPEYISPHLLHEVLTRAGRLVGVGDFRPTYGRFAIVGFEVLAG